MPTHPSRAARPARRRSLLLALLGFNLAAAALAWAEAPVAPPPPRQGATSNASAAGTDFHVDVKASVYYLASDELEGRGIGTAGIDKAADFIADNFRKLGLKPPPGQQDYFQHFKFTTATRPGDDTTLAFKSGDDDATTYDLDKQYTPLSFSGEKQFDARIVFVGYSISSKQRRYDDFAGVDVKGKVALALRYEPHDNQGYSRFTGTEEYSRDATLARKADAAAEAGAVALVIVNPPAFHEENDPLMPFAAQYRGEQSKIPILQVRRKLVDQWLGAAGVEDDLRALQRKIDNSGEPASFALPEKVRLSGNVSVQRVQKDVKNVVAMLPGRGPLANEYVVVGAHYDHLGKGGPGSLAPGVRAIHNGADDNASGTSAMLKLADHYAHAEVSGRSMIFCAFTAEEVGLVGSQHFVSHPPVPLSQLAYMVNLDMVGRVRNDILYVGGHGTAPVLDKAIAKADEKSPLRFKSFGRGGFGPSDHMSFAMKRIPVLFFYTGNHRDYHTPTDDAEKVNYKGIEQVVAFATDVIDTLLAAPREQYVEAADANSMFNGPGASDPAASSPHGAGTPRSASGGIRVTLGVVPDYAPEEDVKGLRISGTTPGSPAANAGLKEGDVLVQINDDKVGSIYDLTDILARGKPGQKVKIAVIRDGKRVETQTTLAERKAAPLDAGPAQDEEDEKNPHGKKD
jgi:hypothetical protein